MNKIKLILSVLSIFVGVSLFAQQSETRNLSAFTKLSLSTAAKVHLTQGSTQKVELKGSEDVLKDVETEVRGGHLIIKRKSTNWFKWSDSDDLEVYITMSKIDELNVSGSGKVYGKNKFETSDLEIGVSGSGGVDIETNTTDLDLSISGSGKIELKGSASHAKVSISGSGSLEAEDLKAISYKIIISGSGSCTVNAEKSIDASISGSGSVYYKGNPANINSSTSGSGKVKKI